MFHGDFVKHLLHRTVRFGVMAKGIKTGGGCRAGIPNKSTREARQAIGLFVDANADRLQEWLDQVAHGVKNEDGEYVVPPNPEKAFQLFNGVIEYHVPKLARTENTHTGADGGPINMSLNVKFGK